MRYLIPLGLWALIGADCVIAAMPWTPSQPAQLHLDVATASQAGELTYAVARTGHKAVVEPMARADGTRFYCVKLER